MLVVDNRVEPLILLERIGKHYKARSHDNEDSKHHQFLHEHDHESVNDTSKDEHERVNHCNVSLVVPLQAVVQGPVPLRNLHCVFKPKSILRLLSNA